MKRNESPRVSCTYLCSCVSQHVLRGVQDHPLLRDPLMIGPYVLANLRQAWKDPITSIAEGLPHRGTACINLFQIECGSSCLSFILSFPLWLYCVI